MYAFFFYLLLLFVHASAGIKYQSYNKMNLGCLCVYIYRFGLFPFLVEEGVVVLQLNRRVSLN